MLRERDFSLEFTTQRPWNFPSRPQMLRARIEKIRSVKMRKPVTSTKDISARGICVYGVGFILFIIHHLFYYYYFIFIFVTSTASASWV